MIFEIGKDYKTRGGWKAKIVWTHSCGTIHVVHKPGEGEYVESIPVIHNEKGKAVGLLSVGEAPTYGQHPADLISEWKD